MASPRLAAGLAWSLAVPACGDALLPGDYAGAGSVAVSAKVSGASDDVVPEAQRPRLTLQWLTRQGWDDAAGPALAGQAVTFNPSPRLTAEWDLGLAPPLPAATRAMPSAGDARVSVGKLIYYDDVVADERLDWACRGAVCDRVQAVSREYIVYIDRPIERTTSCSGARVSVSRSPVGAGFHYYAPADANGDETPPHELTASVALTLVVGGGDLAENDPTEALQAFGATLGRTWASGPSAPFEGCGRSGP